MKLKLRLTDLAETKRKDMIDQGNVVHPGGMRRKNAPYIAIWILYYAWVVAFATWWTVSPIQDSFFEMQLRELMHIVNLLSSSVFVFLIRKEWFVKTARIGAVLIAVSMIFFYVLPSAGLKTAAALTASAAIGCLNISILIPFVFILNNTEKLYAVITANALIQVVLLVKEHGPAAGSGPLLQYLLLAFALSAVFFFKHQSGSIKNTGDHPVEPGMSSRIYLSLLFNCAIIILCKGVGKGILNTVAVDSSFSVLTGYYLGGLVSCLVYLGFYAFTKKAYIWLGNFTFSSFTIGLLCSAFIPQASWLAMPFAVLLGLASTVGMINMYYIIGVIAKKYDNMRYLRISILFIGLCGGIFGILTGSLISQIGTFEVTVYASILSAAVMIAFMFVSPVMERRDYVNDWGLDSAQTEVTGEKLSVFEPFKLSRREAEVCELLLQGYTLRQTSVILSIAYATVNTYCTSAYRKLSINSRTELLLKFKDHIKA